MHVSVIYYENLPEDEQKKMGSPPFRRQREANYLRVDFGNGDVRYYSDAMEPEDALFTRGLRWIKRALELAFEAGKESVQ